MPNNRSKAATPSYLAQQLRDSRRLRRDLFEAAAEAARQLALSGAGCPAAIHRAAEALVALDALVVSAASETEAAS